MSGCIGGESSSKTNSNTSTQPPVETDEQLIQKVDNAINNPDNADMQNQGLTAVSELITRDNPKVNQSQVIDWLVVSGAKCLDTEANWINQQKGKQIYDLLKRINQKLVIDSLSRQILNSNIRIKVLYLAVKLGIPNTEEKLNQILLSKGDKKMAEDFLNSGSDKLYEGGKQWGKKHGYVIQTGQGSHRVSWGQF